MNAPINAPIQTAVMPWFSESVTESAVFSVYRTPTSIELHSGCSSIDEARLVCSHVSHRGACEFAQLLAQESYLPFKDCTRVPDHPIDTGH